MDGPVRLLAAATTAILGFRATLPSASSAAASRSFCALTDTSGYVVMFDRNGWSQPANVDATGGFFTISCPAAASCTAIDLAGRVLSYDGAS